jgi:hypothetical protein
LLIPIAIFLGAIIYLAIKEQGGRVRKFFIESYAGLSASQLQNLKAQEPIILNILQRLAVSWRLGLLFISCLWLINNISEAISQITEK